MSLPFGGLGRRDTKSAAGNDQGGSYAARACQSSNDVAPVVDGKDAVSEACSARERSRTPPAANGGRQASSGFSGASSPRSSAAPPARPGRGSGRGASGRGRSAGCGGSGSSG